MIRCKVLVVNEQMNPITHSMPIDTSTVCRAVLETHELQIKIEKRIWAKEPYGEYEYLPSIRSEFILTQASSIWLTVYATLDTPAVWPRRLHHPWIHEKIGTWSAGTTCLVTKYIPPAVGYADTSSATELPMHMAMHEPISQHQTAVAGPPAARGAPNVAGTEPKTPRMEMAYETVDHFENSRRSS